MANAIMQAGGASEPTSFAPLHTNRMFTGLWTNRNPLTDASVSTNMEKYGLGLQDSIIAGLNTELSSQLTLRRRRGTSVYNTQTFPPINRFYPFNTFTLTSEVIRVMADTGMGGGVVYDATSNSTTPNTKTAIWTKSAGAGPTFFLGLGNTLYFTNGVDNKIWDYTTNQIFNWGIVAPSVAPTVFQTSRPTNYPAWQANDVYGSAWRGMVTIYDIATNTLQRATRSGVTGSSQPAFSTTPYATVPDGSLYWEPIGSPSTSAEWHSNYSYGFTDAVIGHVSTGATTTTPNLFVLVDAGTTGLSGTTLPIWTSGLGTLTHDGSITWMNCGVPHQWSDYGPGTTITQGFPLGVTIPDNQGYTIIDPNGYLQSIAQSGKSGATAPTSWNRSSGAQTTDGSIIWVNQGGLSPEGTGAWQYGYAYVNGTIGDISGMSPASVAITIGEGNQVVVQGTSSTDPQVNTIYIYRTAQGGSTFLYLGQITNTPGTPWSFTDTTPDSGLNITIQAQVNGEGTPLPTGATCIAYHLQRFFVAVGNVIYVSSGPDAIASTSSGNAGFNTTFTVQSKIIRFWVSPLGLVVLTVRDSYIVLGTGTSADPLYVTTFIDGIPLLHYDAFTTHLTTPYMMTGTGMLIALDPSAGITEVGFPIADKLEADFDPSTAYVTYHSQASKENALYVDDGIGSWYRMSATTAPETGLNWSPKATLVTPSSAVQSVEILPGTNRLLIGPGTATGPIRMRDLSTNTDLGVPYTCHATFGSIVLAHPGELAQLAFFTLEAKKIGSRAALSVLLGEIFATANAPFEPLGRTRQDPTNLPPSETLYSDRYHFMQSQNPAWCRHFQMDIAWPAEDAANELLTFTIFGQTWQEYRSQ